MFARKKSLRLIDAPVYRYWQAFYMSFYSKLLYKDVNDRWRGYGVLYAFTLIVFLSIPLTIKVVITFNSYFQNEVIDPISKIPNLYVQQGQIIFDKPMPYKITNSLNEVVGIIDTTGEVTGYTNKYPHLSMLITREKIYFKPPKPNFFFSSRLANDDDQILEQVIDSNANQVFKGEDWLKSSKIMEIKLFSDFLIYPLMVMFFFGLYIVLLFVFGLLGQLFAVIFFDKKLKYKNAVRVFSVASTPEIFVFYMSLTFNLVFPGIGFLYIALLAIYFSYGIISIKSTSNKLVHS